MIHIGVYGKVPGIDITDDLLEELICNGMFATFYGPVKAISPDDQDFIIDLNVTGSMVLLKGAEKRGISGVSLNPDAPDSFSLVDITHVDVFGSGSDALTLMVRDFVKTGVLTARGVITSASGKRGVMHGYGTKAAAEDDRVSVSDQYNIVEQSDLAMTIVNVLVRHQDGPVRLNSFGENSRTVELTEFCKTLFEEMKKYVLRMEAKSEETLVPTIGMPTAPLSRTTKVREVKGLPESNGYQFKSLATAIRICMKREMEALEDGWPARAPRYDVAEWVVNEPKLGMGTKQSGKAYHGNGFTWHAPKHLSGFHKELDFDITG